MTSRLRLAIVAGALAVSGCVDTVSTGPLSYSHDGYLDLEGKDVGEKLAEKPKLRARALALVDSLFGARPDTLKVPADSGLPENGARLAGRMIRAPGAAPVRVTAAATAGADPTPIRGGYAIYREQCMHCHGVSGDGNGPTSPFLWPVPRDYRPGVFKFTSTSGSDRGSKPTRADLRRTLVQGIPNTSMPSFESILSASEIEQVIDYVMFLSMRGETEYVMLEEAAFLEEPDAETELTDEMALEVAAQVFESWKSAEANVVAPQTPIQEATRESILRGKQLYLGDKSLQCFGCHGLDGKGNGDSFVDYKTFKQHVFEGNPSRSKFAQLAAVAVEQNKKAVDRWGNPIRPANLLKGDYKGGRRPIDLYWRIAKGINGTPMPAHLGTQIDEKETWDLVNFVLRLPYEPQLLDGAQPYVAPAAEATTGTPSADGPGDLADAPAR